jgi:hypothetical protein
MNIENLRRTKKTGYHGSGSFRVTGALGNVDKLISDNSVSNFYKTTETVRPCLKKTPTKVRRT